MAAHKNSKTRHSSTRSASVTLSPAEKAKRTRAENAAREEAEKVADYLADTLRRMREKTINAPTILYKVGERVQHGLGADSRVTEVLDGGKILKLHEVSINENSGGQEESDSYVNWHDITPYRSQDEAEEIERFHKKDDIDLRFSAFDIETVINRFYNRTDLSPDYQRELVWEPKDKVALIDSIFNNIEIGKIVFIKLGYEPSLPHYWEILDGKQRITALVEFFEGRFRYRGKTFHEMHPRDRHHFLNYSFQTATAENVTPAQKYRYFLKLNTAGRPQDPAHLAKVKKLLASEEDVSSRSGAKPKKR